MSIGGLLIIAAVVAFLAGDTEQAAETLDAKDEYYKSLAQAEQEATSSITGAAVDAVSDLERQRKEAAAKTEDPHERRLVNIIYWFTEGYVAYVLGAVLLAIVGAFAGLKR